MNNPSILYRSLNSSSGTYITVPKYKKLSQTAAVRLAIKPDSAIALSQEAWFFSLSITELTEHLSEKPSAALRASMDELERGEGEVFNSVDDLIASWEDI